MFCPDPARAGKEVDDAARFYHSDGVLRLAPTSLCAYGQK
jgi:hypothetical protein